jgi:hypothetical protein
MYLSCPVPAGCIAVASNDQASLVVLANLHNSG